MSDVEHIVHIRRPPASNCAEGAGKLHDRPARGEDRRGADAPGLQPPRKGCEQRSYTQDLYLVERICGYCSYSHSTAFVQAVEDIGRVGHPPAREIHLYA